MAFLVKGTNIIGGKIEESGASALADLTDVSITNPTDGQTLLYNSTTHKFENADGGSANIPEYTYSYWLAHRAELEATGKPFIVTNAPPSPDLTAENVGYGTSNVGAALDSLFGNNVVENCSNDFTSSYAIAEKVIYKVGHVVFLYIRFDSRSWTVGGEYTIGNLSQKLRPSAARIRCLNLLYGTNNCFTRFHLNSLGDLSVTIANANGTGNLEVSMTYITAN